MTRPWFVFDADDTLWYTLEIYQNATRSAATRISNISGVAVDTIIAWIDAEDIKRAHIHGYHRNRYPETLACAARHFGYPVLADACRAIGEAVYTCVARPREGVEAMLRMLSALAPVAIVTAGDDAVQAKRLKDFAYIDQCTQTRIVPHKDRSTWSEALSSIGADPAHTWVVGDSLRSDILPTHALGCKPIRLMSQNWAGYEGAGDHPEDVPMFATLTEVGQYLRQAWTTRR